MQRKEKIIGTIGIISALFAVISPMMEEGKVLLCLGSGEALACLTWLIAVALLERVKKNNGC